MSGWTRWNVALAVLGTLLAVYWLVRLVQGTGDGIGSWLGLGSALCIVLGQWLGASKPRQ